MILSPETAPGTSALDAVGLRATRAIVDLDAIAANVQAVKTVLSPETRIMAVVKADAYGHGAPWVAAMALQAGASLLGVATVSEGQILRSAGTTAPIVLLGSIDPAEAPAACRLHLELTIADDVLLDAVQRAARARGLDGRVRVHLKIDSGLRRYGAPADIAIALASRIAADSELVLAGVCTHFASADEADDPFTATQIERFEHAVEAIQESGVRIPARHAANSAGILTGQSTGYEIVRLGISLYGVPPSPDVKLLPSMRPAMRVESRIARLLAIAAGDTVGYNRTFRAAKPTRGALIPIGYADGYRRAFSGRSWVGMQGQSAGILGRVSMDQLVVEIPAGVTAGVGDIVTVLSGDPATAAPSAMDLADMANTNAHEILVGIRQRVPRVFLRGGKPIAYRTGSESAG